MEVLRVNFGAGRVTEGRNATKTRRRCIPPVTISCAVAIEFSLSTDSWGIRSMARAKWSTLVACLWAKETTLVLVRIWYKNSILLVPHHLGWMLDKRELTVTFFDWDGNMRWANTCLTEHDNLLWFFGLRSSNPKHDFDFYKGSWILLRYLAAAAQTSITSQWTLFSRATQFLSD